MTRSACSAVMPIFEATRSASSIVVTSFMVPPLDLADFVKQLGLFFFNGPVNFCGVKNDAALPDNDEQVGKFLYEFLLGTWASIPIVLVRGNELPSLLHNLAKLVDWPERINGEV